MLFTALEPRAMSIRAVLYPEQAAIVLIMAILLFSSSGWGLVDSQRIELLTHGMEFSSQQKAALTAERDQFYERLDSSRQKQADDIAQRLVEGGHIEVGEWGQLPDDQLSQSLKTTAFRAYLLGSTAMDERNAYRALSRIKPSSLDFDPKFYRYGGSYLYLVGGLIYLGKITGLIQVSHDLAWYLDHPSHMARLYLVGRGVNIAAFLAILVLLALWSRRLGSRAIGFLAMMTWSLAWLVWWETLVSKPHMYATFWSLWSLFLLDAWLKDKRAWRLWLAGAALGMSIGASLPTAVLALAFPVFTYEPGKGWTWLKLSLLGWLVAIGVFFLTNPYAVIKYELYLLTAVEHGGGGGWDWVTATWEKPLAYFKKLTLDYFPFPLMMIGLAAVLVIAFRRQGPLIRLARLLAVLLLAWSLTVASPRLSIFLLAPVCLFAGLALDQMLLSNRRVPTWAARIAIILLLLPGMVSLAIQAKAALSGNLWHQSAKAWLESGGLASNSSVGVYEPPDPTRLPPFPFLNRPVVMLDKWKPDQDQPDVLVLNQKEYQRLWPRHQLYQRYEPHTRLGQVPCPAWLNSLMVRCPQHAYTNAMVLKRK